MSIFIRVCRSVDYEKIRLITNEAFMHDAFFKKEEYVVRFGKDSVTDYMSNPQSTFLVAEEKNELVGSIYLKWTVDDDQITGNFSAVSVPDKCTRRGIGRRLVAAAEQYILDLEGPEKRVLEAGVISLREDLFKWFVMTAPHSFTNPANMSFYVILT
jgi:predicted N-acetyltransferase YhbS